MANIDKVSVKNTVYNIVSPAVVSDYIEVIGGACTKPDGYEEDEVILAKQNDVQLLFKATQDIAFGANIVENTNCVRTTLEEVLKNAGGGGGASSADQVSYDNSDSGLEAENVQEAVDELATNAGTASSQIQTLTNEVDAIVNVYGSKNLFQYDYPSTTLNGVTITINRDKTISLSGTASADTWIILNAKVHLDTTREYILNGCPSGGSASTYNLVASDSSSWWQLDTGEGVRFTPTGADNTQIYIQFPSGTDMTGKVFKPMIRLASIQDDTYERYAMTNRELTENAKTLKTSIDSIKNGTLDLPMIQMTADVKQEIISSAGMYLLFIDSSVVERCCGYMVHVHATDTNGSIQVPIYVGNDITITFDMTVAAKLKMTANKNCRVRMIKISDFNY